MIVTFKADISDAQSKVAQLKSDVSSVSDTAQTAGAGISSGFGGAIGSIVSFGAQVGQTIFGVQQLASGAVSLAQSLLQPAATAETTQLSFTTLLHSTKAAQQAMTDLNTYAASTPMQTQWVDNAAAKILAFGGKMTDVKPEINAIGDALSGLGKLSEASLNSIVDIFGKISAQGKITGGDMMQLSTWGIPAWQALSDAMHKPIPVLQQMVSAGAIPANVAIKALEQGMEHTFGGGMAKQANTFTGLMSTLASNWQIAMAAIGSPVLKLAEQALGNIGTILASPAFQQFATNVGQKIADVFARIGSFVSSAVVPAFQQLGPIIGQIGAYIQGDDFQGFVADVQTVGNQISRMLTPAFQSLAPYIPSLGQVLQALGGVISGIVVPALDNIVFPLGQFLLYLNENKTAMDVFKAALIGIGVAFAAIQIGSFIATIPALVAGFIAWATTAGAAAVATIAATWPLLAIGAAIAVAVAIIVLAVQHWGDIVKWLQGVWSGIAGFFSGLWAKIQGIFGSIGQWFQDRFKQASDGVQAAWKGVQNFFTGIWQGIQSGTQNAMNVLGTILKIGGQILYYALFGGIIAIVALFQWLYNHNYYFKDLIDSIVNFVKAGVAWLEDAWTATVNFIVDQWNQLTSFADALWSAIVTTITGYITAVTTWITAAWGVVTGWLSAQWNKIAAIATAVWNVVSTTVQHYVGIAVSFLQSIWTAAATWIQTQWNKIASFAQAAWAAVSAVFSSIWNTYISKPLQGLWNSISQWFTNLGTSAMKSGQNFVSMLASGITSGAGWIWNAVVGIANTIWKALGFHSPAKAGPGADADRWMPNLVNMLASGLQAGQPKMQQASFSLIQPLATVASYPQRSAAALAGPALAASNAGGGTSHTFILEFDGRQFVKQVVGPNLGKEVRLKLGAKGWSI